MPVYCSQSEFSNRKWSHNVTKNKVLQPSKNMATEPGHTYSVTQNLVLGLQVIQNLICIISWLGYRIRQKHIFPTWPCSHRLSMIGLNWYYVSGLFYCLTASYLPADIFTNWIWIAVEVRKRICHPGVRKIAILYMLSTGTKGTKNNQKLVLRVYQATPPQLDVPAHRNTDLTWISLGYNPHLFYVF